MCWANSQRQVASNFQIFNLKTNENASFFLYLRVKPKMMRVLETNSNSSSRTEGVMEVVN